MAEERKMQEKLEEEATCPICKEFYFNPVTLSCGHNFCSTCLEKVLDFSERRPECPLCREVVQIETLKPNRQLSNMLEVVQDMSNLLKYRGVCSVEEADKKLAKDQISRGLEVLQKGREGILGYTAETQKTSQDMLDVINKNMKESEDAFRTLGNILQEEKEKFLTQLDELKVDIERKRDENLAVYSEEVSSLDDFIKGTKRKFQEFENDLHKISGDFLESCKKRKKKSSKKAFELPADLNWRMNDCKDVSVFLEVFMKEFQKSMEPGLQLKEANVKLNPSYVHPLLIVSEDKKSVRFEDRQDLPDDPTIYENRPYVIAEEGIVRGRYFWDVDVSNAVDWSVGVAVMRNDGSNKSYVVKMRMFYGKYSVFNFTGVEEPASEVITKHVLKKIRVIVNTGAREVGFYNADTGDILTIQFINVPLEELVAVVPYFAMSRKGHLTLCPAKCQSQQRAGW